MNGKSLKSYAMTQHWQYEENEYGGVVKFRHGVMTQNDKLNTIAATLYVANVPMYDILSLEEIAMVTGKSQPIGDYPSDCHATVKFNEGRGVFSFYFLACSFNEKLVLALAKILNHDFAVKRPQHAAYIKSASTPDFAPMLPGEKAQEYALRTGMAVADVMKNIALIPVPRRPLTT